MDVMSVLGPIQSRSLGLTLPHEHLLSDLYVQFQPHREFMLFDVDLACEELARFAAVGGRTLVDLTTSDIGRNPLDLRDIASRTGVNVVMGTGRYREPFYESDLWRRSVQDIADEFVADIEVGAADGIRAGIIGEIGVHARYISPVEERIHRAAARAQKRSGLALTTHSIASPIGLDQLDIFEDEGVDLRRVVIGHSDTYPRLEYHREILRRGAYVEFDTIRGTWERDTRRQLDLVVQLVAEGYGDRILLSQDVCTTHHLAAYGGTGYAFVASTFAAQLKDAGLAQEQIDTLLVLNPARMLSGDS